VNEIDVIAQGRTKTRIGYSRGRLKLLGKPVGIYDLYILMGGQEVVVGREVKVQGQGL
jgi:hypothetical protein